MEQSAGLLAASLALFLAATSRLQPTVRAAIVVACSLAVAGLLVLAPFPLTAVDEIGDYATYIRDLDEYLRGGFRMEAPLGWAIVNVLWTIVGRTDATAPDAFGWLITLFMAILLIGLNGVAYLERWSVRSVRYLALCFAAPAMLLFAGYREFAFLPLALAATALPLLLLAIERQARGLLIIAFLLLGTGGAVHAFGLITLVAGVLGVIAAGVSLQTALLCAAAGVGGYAVWFVLFLVSGATVSVGHANHLDLRALFRDERVEYVSRTKPGLFTVRGMRDVVTIYVLGGTTLCWTLLAPAIACVRNRNRNPEVLAVAAVLIPCMGAAALIWPIQGLAVDTDIVMGLSPAFYALAWLAAGRSTITVAASWLLLAASHGVFWWAVQSPLFVNR